MGELIEANFITHLDIPTERILRKAQEENLSTAIVVGWDSDGEFYFASSAADGGDVLWLLELAKKKLLEVEG